MACGPACLVADLGRRELAPQLGDASVYDRGSAKRGFSAQASLQTVREEWRCIGLTIFERACRNRSLTLLVKSTGRFTRGLSERSSPLFDYRTRVTIPCAIEGVSVWLIYLGKC